MGLGQHRDVISLWMHMKTEKIVSNHTINSTKYRESRNGRLFWRIYSLPVPWSSDLWRGGWVCGTETHGKSGNKRIFLWLGDNYVYFLHVILKQWNTADARNTFYYFKKQHSCKKCAQLHYMRYPVSSRMTDLICCGRPTKALVVHQLGYTGGLSTDCTASLLGPQPDGPKLGILSVKHHQLLATGS